MTFKFAGSPLHRYVRLMHNRRSCYLQDRDVGACRRYFALKLHDPQRFNQSSTSISDDLDRRRRIGKSDLYLNIHRMKCIGVTDETAGHWHGLANVACDSDGD